MTAEKRFEGIYAVAGVAAGAAGSSALTSGLATSVAAGAGAAGSEETIRYGFPSRAIENRARLEHTNSFLFLLDGSNWSSWGNWLLNLCWCFDLSRLLNLGDLLSSNSWGSGGWSGGSLFSLRWLLDLSGGYYMYVNECFQQPRFRRHRVRTQGNVLSVAAAAAGAAAAGSSVFFSAFFFGFRSDLNLALRLALTFSSASRAVNKHIS
jgi:hypothetical protein